MRQQSVAVQALLFSSVDLLSAFRPVSSRTDEPFRQEMSLKQAVLLRSWPKHSPGFALYTSLSKPYLAKQPHASNLIFPRLSSAGYASLSLITFQLCGREVSSLPIHKLCNSVLTYSTSSYTTAYIKPDAMRK